ncbi:hypothetical protein HGRIS_012206 [Hohenbuehelia grisea]|uniref:Uncharacterized protein n=1 Tax=Hohenbuehelia grisea TaxID=104357 RepID=A0ABR3IRJ9_9AGAR
MISSDQVLFISFFALSFLQGFFTLLLGILFYLVMSRPRLRGKRSYWGLAVAIFFYCKCLTHFVMAFYQDYRLFTGEGWTDMKAYARFGFAQISIDYVGCIVADILLVWRMWVVYNKDAKAIIIPSLLVLGSAIACFGYVGTAFRSFETTTSNTMAEIWAATRGRPMQGFSVTVIVLSTITNVLLTTMIAIKFIRHHRSMREMLGSTTLLFESIVIIESGAIYALAWVARLLLFITSSFAAGIVNDIIGQLSGIVPTLIIVTITAGFSPVSRPDLTSRHSGPAGVREPHSTSVVVESRFSVALNPDVTQTSVASESESSGAIHAEDINEKNTDFREQPNTRSGDARV